MANDDIQTLKAVIQERAAVLIVGTGVSAAMVSEDQRDLTTWHGLIRNGLEHARRYCNARTETVEQHKKWLKSELDDLTFKSIIDYMVSSLKKRNQFEPWLRNSVGALRVHDPRVGDALRYLGLPIITTNYDDLLEQVTTYGPISWRHRFAMREFLRGQMPNRILHLHGVWEDPESIIADAEAYKEIASDQKTQEVLTDLLKMRWIFIGYGAGLDDYHFTRLRSRLKANWGEPPFVLLDADEYADRARLCLKTH